MTTEKSDYREGTWMWCEEDGREECKIGGLSVYLSPKCRRAWNDGEYDNPHTIRCHIPTHQPDHSCVRDGEVVVNLGLPEDWYGTVGEAIAGELLEEDYYESEMNGCEAVKDT